MGFEKLLTIEKQEPPDVFRMERAVEVFFSILQRMGEGSLFQRDPFADYSTGFWNLFILESIPDCQAGNWDEGFG